MGLSILSIVQNAGAEMGLGSPSVVVGNNNEETRQLLALLKAAGNELARQYDWQALATEYRFTTQFLTTTGNWTNGSAIVSGIPSTSTLAAGNFMVTGVGVPQDCYILSVDSATQVTLNQPVNSTQTGAAINFCKTKYTMPTDYDRPIDRTQWDKSKHWEMGGPLTAQEWQLLKSGYISTGPRIQFRRLGNFFQTWPPVATPEYIGFEYVSKNWVYDLNGVAKDSITADTDTLIFPDRLITIFLKLKFFEAKSFDTTAHARDFTEQLSIAKANDGGSKTLSLSPRGASILVTDRNLPDTNYGL